MAVSVRPFSFETSYDTRDVYPSPRRPAKAKFGLTDDQLFVAFALFGAVCLVWPYTIALGAFVLAMTTFAWAMRERSRKWRSAYQGVIEPPAVVRVGANETGYWIRGDGFFAENRWDGVLNGIEHDGFLIVQARHMPRVQFPTEELRTAGVYEPIHSLVDERTARYREALERASREANS